jgi:kynureninase
MSGTPFEKGLAFARGLDAEDPLAGFRDRFHIPRTGTGDETTYLCGNSLGLQPRLAADYVGEALDKWQTLGVKGHFEGEHPWMPYHEFLAQGMEALVGARPGEAVTMNSLTVNLHLMMVSFYRPDRRRYKILVEDGAFPSDRYAVESKVRFHGFEPEAAIIRAAPRAGEACLRQEDIEAIIEAEGEAIALILLPCVQYYTGQVFDMEAIVRAGHKRGCTVGFDLAHAVGNISLQLHDWDVDFAVWCTYKYLNSGPGSVGGCFVHARHGDASHRPRFAGWWGHDKADRFDMIHPFNPTAGVEGWQLSNPPILSLAAIRASLDLFGEAGYMAPLRKKSERLTGYLAWLLAEEMGDRIAVITPEDPAARGCQLSLTVSKTEFGGRELFDRLDAAGVVADWREPNVIRVAPVPLYNRFEDCFRFVEHLKANYSGRG